MKHTQSSYTPITIDLMLRIREALGDDAVVCDQEALERFSKDATEACYAPELVVQPTSTDQVQALFRLASEYRFPVTPRGLGTGLVGGALPLYGGVVLSMARMNRILSIDRDNMIALVEPGVVNLDLKKAARLQNLFYPPDPASLDTCSLGGNSATNAAGPSCVKYGTTRDYILGLEAVLPSGEVIQVGGQTRKRVVGYSLLHLLIGSEGTLAVITKLILKLISHPPSVGTLVVLFPDLTAAMRAVTSILNAGHVPCALEFMDHHCLEIVGDLLPFEGLREAGSFLLVEVDGIPEIIGAELESTGKICLECGAVNAFLAPDSYKRAQMWDVRKQVSLRIEQRSPLYVPEDIAVPIARIADFVDGLPELERDYGIKIYAFGHAGDGNIHLNITGESREDAERVEGGVRAALEKALSMGGTISAEHGIGMAKKQFLPMELSSESIRIQREIKRIFDPHMILNPGKIFCMDDNSR